MSFSTIATLRARRANCAIAALLISGCHASSNTTECGPGYTRATWTTESGAEASTCVQLVTGEHNFDRCETKTCPSRGGRLAAAATAAEYDAIIDAVVADALEGGWPKGCAYFGMTRCKTSDWRWTTSDAPTDGLWAAGEPNDWGGVEECAMVCPGHATGDRLNDGPCWNTVSCVCEATDAASSYEKGDCPEPVWWGWCVLAFLLSFIWWATACSCKCCKTKHGAVKLAIGFELLLTALIYHLVVAPGYGENDAVGLCGLLGLLGIPVGCAVAARGQPETGPGTPSAEAVAPLPLAVVAEEGHVAGKLSSSDNVVVQGEVVAQPVAWCNVARR